MCDDPLCLVEVVVFAASNYLCRQREFYERRLLLTAHASLSEAYPLLNLKSGQVNRPDANGILAEQETRFDGAFPIANIV
jgi:hypothetical protein